MAKEQGPLSGFRDMLPEQMIPRQDMLQKIKNVYEGYGFTPLDTPAIERYETLTGKYGEEGEKLMYKFTDHGGRMLALRYDLTVPLARVVAQHKSELPLPYKRYQVGNVWRGESPQSGRYREFMQFDADTVGTKSTMADAEVVAMMSDAMHALGAEAQVRVNNRRLLDALVEKAGIQDEAYARTLISTIDKVDKIGEREALTEIDNKLGTRASKLSEQYLNLKGSTQERINQVESLLKDADGAEEGVSNLREVFKLLESAGYSSEQIVFDQRIARGLDYYTGIIYETTLNDLPGIGSVCSGGRYDNLVKALGGPDLPAVGTSIGVDRLFAGLQQLGKVSAVKTPTQIMIANFNASDQGHYMRIAAELRKEGMPTEIYADPSKLGKQFSFANKLGIPHVVIAGPDELAANKVKIKDMKTGEQTEVDIDTLSTRLDQLKEKNSESE
jgi:histidyl-tRNA synthetase